MGPLVLTAFGSYPLESRVNQGYLVKLQMLRRGGRVVESARLESVFTLTGNEGSNPSLSAIIESNKKF